MKRLFFLSALVLGLAACSHQADMTIQVQGDSQLNGMAYLYNLADKGTIVDSVLIENGQAYWETNAPLGEIYRISIPEAKYRDEFVGEKGVILVNIPDFSITGTPLNNSLSQLLEKLTSVQDEREMVTAITDAMALHANDALGSLLLYYLDMFVEAEEAEEAFQVLEAGAEAPALTQHILENWAIIKQSAAGQPYIDIEVEYNGETKRISDYIGGTNKLTIVDFWASWCGPCKREIPFLIDAYNKYHEQGVEVLGVATWDEPEATLKAIEQLGITYSQILNAQSIGSDAYGIKGIPEIIMIGADGTILARGLRGAAIEEAILQHLK